jgi:hypothetical protein
MGCSAASQRGNTKKVYKTFLTGKLTNTQKFSLADSVAQSFYENVRNGILHDTETRKGWIIEQTRPKNLHVEQIGQNFVLNRSMFHEALKSEFEQWLERLRAGDRQLRLNMKNRMKELVEKHFDS